MQLQSHRMITKGADWRRRLSPLVVAAALGFLILDANGALAQGASPAPETAHAANTGAPQENWTVNCAGEGSDKACTMIQNLVTDQQQRLLTILLQADQKGGPTLLFVLPHGLFLPAGVQVQIDGGSQQKLVIQTADQNGSYAGLPVTPALLDTLRKGSELKVTFLSAQQKGITVPVTLSGFSKSYESYEAKTPSPGGSQVAAPSAEAAPTMEPGATPVAPPAATSPVPAQ